MKIISRVFTSTKNYNCRIDMKFLLFMLLIASSNAGLIKRDNEFPNLQTVHHGNGATSYQNVEVKNGPSIIIGTENHRQIYQEHENHEFQYDISLATNAVPISNDYGTGHDFYLTLDDDSYAQNNIESNELSGYYDNYYDPGYDYGYLQ